MFDLWKVLIPILITDILNPVLFGFMVYAAGTNRPITNSIAVLIGHTTAYFCGGIVLALGFERISHRLANPKFIDFIIELIVGLILICIAIPSRKKPKKRGEKNDKGLSPPKAFGWGAIINFIGLPFAIPYFATINQILKADFTALVSIFMLIIYNLLYALPFTIVPILVAAIGKESRPILTKINNVIDKVSGFLMPILLALVGIALLADSIFYFINGESLF